MRGERDDILLLIDVPIDIVPSYPPKSNLRCLKCGSRQRVKLDPSNEFQHEMCFQFIAAQVGKFRISQTAIPLNHPIILDDNTGCHQGLVRIARDRRGRFPRAKWTRISQVRDVEFNFAARSIVQSSSLHAGITPRAKVVGNSRVNGGVIKVILRRVSQAQVARMPSVTPVRCTYLNTRATGLIISSILKRFFVHQP